MVPNFRTGCLSRFKYILALLITASAIQVVAFADSVSGLNRGMCGSSIFSQQHSYPMLSGQARVALATAAESPVLAPWQRPIMRDLTRGPADPSRLQLGPESSLFQSPINAVAEGDWTQLLPLTGWAGHTAIYDPVRDRMVVFGGHHSEFVSTDVWVLSLQGTPRWTRLLPSGIPPLARSGHTAVYDPVHDQMVVFGGYNSGYFGLNDTWVLTLGPDPAWKRLYSPVSVPVPGGRWSHAVIWDPGRNQMVVFGGIINGQPDFWNDTWVATLGDSVWWTRLQPVGTPPSVRGGHTAIYDPVRDRMVVFGGSAWSNMFYNDVWVLSLGLTPTWTQLLPGGTLPSQRSGHAAVYDQARDQMVVFGGSSASDSWTLSLGDGPTWTQLEPSGGLPFARSSPTAIYDPIRARTLIFGGSDVNGQDNDTWALTTGESPTWTELFPAGSGPCNRSCPTAVYDPLRNSIVVFGGCALNDVWMLSLADAAWTRLFPTGSAPPPRSRHAAIYDSIGDRMIVFGGTSDGVSGLNDTWALSLGDSFQWQQIFSSTNPPQQRMGQSAVFDPLRGRMIVFGGRANSRWGPDYNDIWALSLDGAPEWTQVSLSGSLPSARSFHATIYDPVRDRMIVFGGEYQNYPYYLNDTWVLALQGSPEWSQLAPSGDAPAARSLHSAVYDSVRDRMVVFGGQETFGGYCYYFNDVWSIDLGMSPAWVEMAPSGTPPSLRCGHTTTYDPVNDRIVVFGGSGPSSGASYNNTWALLFWSGPTGLTFASASVNAAQGQVTLSWKMTVDVPASSFQIERSETRDGGYTVLATEVMRDSQYSFSCVDRSVSCGRTYWYKIVLVGASGEESYGPVEVRIDAVPVSYQAYQSYPNPFNPLCTIRYDIARAGRVSLRIFDADGSFVRTLVHAWREPGLYNEVWDGKADDGSALPSGVYFYRLEAGDFVATRKMVLLR